MKLTWAKAMEEQNTKAAISEVFIQYQVWFHSNETGLP